MKLYQNIFSLVVQVFLIHFFMLCLKHVYSFLVVVSFLKDILEKVIVKGPGHALQDVVLPSRGHYIICLSSRKRAATTDFKVHISIPFFALALI